MHRQPCRQQQEDAGLAQEEPHGGVGEEDLASQLYCLQPCGLFSVGRFWIEDQSTASQQNQGPDPKDQEGDGLPRTPWRRPARGSGPRSILLSLLMAVLLYELILSMFLYQPFFNSIKSYGFQLWCVILKKQNENSGFIAATLYIRKMHIYQVSIWRVFHH